MFREITKFVTADNVEHESEKKAIEHVENAIHEKLLSIFDGHDLDNSKQTIHRSIQIDIVEYLYKHRKKIASAIAMENY